MFESTTEQLAQQGQRTGKQPWPKGPAAVEWAALSAEERAERAADLAAALADAQREELASLPLDERLAMSESEEHHDLGHDARDTLRRYFRLTSRSIYVACNLSVYYPDQAGFSPDLLAVNDVPAHRREAWIVTEEGKGIDFALEICRKGKRRKDFIDNVKWYAALGIREYFVLDVRRGRLVAYRLPSTEAQEYQPIRGTLGRFHSEVLGLDVAYLGGQLRFSSGSAELRTPEEEAERLTRLAQEAEERVEAEQQRAEEATRRLAASVLAVMQARGLPCSEAVRAEMSACRDLDVLDRWLQRALTAASAEDVLRGECLHLSRSEHVRQGRAQARLTDDERSETE